MEIRSLQRLARSYRILLLDESEESDSEDEALEAFERRREGKEEREEEEDDWEGQDGGERKDEEETEVNTKGDTEGMLKIMGSLICKSRPIIENLFP